MVSWANDPTDYSTSGSAVDSLAPELLEQLSDPDTPVGRVLTATTVATVTPLIAAATAGLQSGPDFVWNGDSLSAMGGGLTPPQNPAAYLATFLGKTVRTNAVGGETSVGIAARQGGNPWMMLPAGNAIPASGAVTVTLSMANGGIFQWPLLQTNGNPTIGQTMHGSLAGIPGVFALVQPSGANTAHQSDDYYTFTRDAAGSAVTVNRPQAFYQDFAIAHRGDVQIIMAGKNDCLNSTTITHDQAVSQVLANVAAMVQYANQAEQRFLVVGVHNGTGEGASNATMYARYVDVNTALQNTYGRRFVDYRKYLIAYGLADAGISPTSNDTADIADDTVPRSLLNSDGTHFQLITRQIVAYQVGLRLLELDWVDSIAPWPTATVIAPPTGDETAFWQTNANFVVTADPVTTASGIVSAITLLTAQAMTQTHQRATATINRGTATSTGLMVRAADGNNFYGVRINDLGNILIYKVIGGTTTSLKGQDGLWTADGAVLAFEVSGSTLTVYVNGVSVLSVTDTSITAPGYAGLRAQAAGATRPTWTGISFTQYSS